MSLQNLPSFKVDIRERIFHQYEYHRLESMQFMNQLIDVEKAAKIGLFAYDGPTNDFCACIYCKGAIGYWESGDDPHTEHTTKYPQCNPAYMRVINIPLTFKALTEYGVRSQWVYRARFKPLAERKESLDRLEEPAFKQQVRNELVELFTTPEMGLHDETDCNAFDEDRRKTLTSIMDSLRRTGGITVDDKFEYLQFSITN